MSLNDCIQAQITAVRPQAVGALLRYFEDLDRAEDAFQEACLRALQRWPKEGLPDQPVAWLIRCARNAGIDEIRKTRRWVEDDQFTGSQAYVEDNELMIDQLRYRDDTLRLFFICCHPELSKVQQIALALKVVAGLSVEEIARAFLVKAKTIEQRITRAKQRVGQTRMAFKAPTEATRLEYVQAVTTMIYLLFNEGYAASGGEAHIRQSLCTEAIRLARVLVRLFPNLPEVLALLSLCLLQHARYRARLDEQGEIVLLENQSRHLWDSAMINEGTVLLEKALRHGQVGPLQLQAAIAATHARAKKAEDTEWEEIARLYAALETLEPSPVIALNRNVAVYQCGRVEEALAGVTSLQNKLDGYFYFHGVHAALLKALNRTEEAKEAFQRALKLAATPAEESYITKELEKL